MSPDPPREDSGDDENRIRRFSGEFIEGMINDEEFFIVPDAPYELDMEEESEYTDSDGDDDGVASSSRQQFAATRTPHNSVTVEGEEQEFLFTEGQGRGRYRLLIPFPTSTVSEESSVDNQGNSRRDNEEGQDGESGDNKTSSSNPGQMSEEMASEAEKPSTSGSCNAEQKREIEMSDEKVEKIKEVMKNITLPSTSIPRWATELDEDSWRRKLNESISKVASSKNDKSVHSSSSKTT